MQQEISDRKAYLARMSKPLQEKLRVTKYINKSAGQVLDVGCADGVVTLAMAQMFKDKQFLGIDLDPGFIEEASRKANQHSLSNVHFECVYLRDLLAREDRFDTVTFISVLHEFYSYGEGISSVLKALADAQELLKPGGDIVVRDMILLEYSKHTNHLVDSMVAKISAKEQLVSRMEDFTSFFGPMTNVHAVNHFLLKYRYEENWERECQEHYVPVTFEQYEQALTLLGMELVLRDGGILPFLKNKWIEDFDLTEEELAPLISTGFLVARKKG